MLLSLFLCHTLFLPGLDSINSTKSNDTNILIGNTQAEQKLMGTNIITEGGPTLQGTPKTLSTQDHDTGLVSLDNVLEREKPLQQNVNSNVVARKGVIYPVKNITGEKSIDNEIAKEPTFTSTHKKNSSEAHQNNTNGSKSLQKLTKETNHKTTTQPLKPLILSNEQLDKMKIQNTDSKTGILLYGESDPSKKIKPMSASRHPGMVMPIVITILVVPMFAVLGYMALRRGQEAWKNRHYKRMDFLLDGMYNE